MTPQLSGRSLFITGGTGFVGKTLLDYLGELHTEQGQRFEVVVLSRDPLAFQAQHPEYAGLPWLQFVQGSLSELPKPDRGYTDVIHAAADTHLQGQGVMWIDQIINGTRAVLDFAVQSGAKRFLLTSSGAVYGPQPADMPLLREDYLGAPPTHALSSTYGQAKRVAEQLCTIYYHEHGLETVVARCFAFAGKHLPLDGPYALGNFIRDALQADCIRVKGDGTAVRSYLDGTDMAHWLITLLERGVPGEAYNVGSDVGINMKDLAHLVGQLLAPTKPVVIEGVEQADGHRSIYVPGISKAARTDLIPVVTLAECIRKFATSAKV
jgi:UDP-glucuronate decarboxylase